MKRFCVFLFLSVSMHFIAGGDKEVSERGWRNKCCRGIRKYGAAKV